MKEIVKLKSTPQKTSFLDREEALSVIGGSCGLTVDPDPMGTGGQEPLDLDSKPDSIWPDHDLEDTLPVPIPEGEKQYEEYECKPEPEIPMYA